jgi:hypothetical protein
MDVSRIPYKQWKDVSEKKLPFESLGLGVILLSREMPCIFSRFGRKGGSNE